MKHLHFAIVALTLVSTAAHAEIYNCPTPRGTLTTQSYPCEGVSRDTGKTLMRLPSSPPPVVASVNVVPASVTLHSIAGGMYPTQAIANGFPITMVVDTGASTVSFSERIADKIGLTCHGTSYSNTANGKVQICTTIIDTLQIGGITLTNVEASVMPDMTDVVLLVPCNIISFVL